MIRRDRIFRWLRYFRHGHSQYFAFALSLVNFIAITSLAFRSALARIPLIGIVFSHELFYAAFVVFTYVPLAVIVGWWDLRKGSVPISASIDAEVSPPARDSFYASVLSMTASVRTIAAMARLSFLNDDREKREALEQLYKAVNDLNDAIVRLSKWAKADSRILAEVESARRFLEELYKSRLRDITRDF